MDILVLAIAFVVILLGAELFTNGIEWFGRKLGLAEGAVGLRARRRRDGAPRDDDPDHRHRVRRRRSRPRRGRRRDPGRAVHAVHARDVRDRRGRPVLAQAAATGTRMAVDTTVLVHDIRYFVDRLRHRDRRRLPAREPGRSIVVAVVLIGIYVYYVKGHLDAEAERRRERARAAAVPSGRPPRLPARAGASRGCGSSTSRSSSPSRFIVGGAYLFVGAVERLAARARRRASCCSRS